MESVFMYANYPHFECAIQIRSKIPGEKQHVLAWEAI